MLILLCFTDIVCGTTKSGARAAGEIVGRNKCENTHKLEKGGKILESIQRYQNWSEKQKSPGYDPCQNPNPYSSDYLIGATGETNGSIPLYVEFFHPNLVNDQTYLTILETYRAAHLKLKLFKSNYINKKLLEFFVINQLENVDSSILNRAVPFNYPDECENPVNLLVLRNTLCSPNLLKQLGEICNNDWCEYTESDCTGYLLWKQCDKIPTEKTAKIQENIQKLFSMCVESEQSESSESSESLKSLEL